jgi:tetratricopeptide (TPR) repeat protein
MNRHWLFFFVTFTAINYVAMKPGFYIPTALLAFSLAYIVRLNTITVTSEKTQHAVLKIRIGCGPDWNSLTSILEDADIPPIPGAGIYKWKISTRNDSAQFYFNQGINMYYGFHIIEAMASFKKAQRFDPSCAIIYWAQALTYGPNINDFGYRASPEALSAVKQAGIYRQNASLMEQALIDALSVRYTADSTDITRNQLNKAYADAMKKLTDKFPSNPDAQALYADALMLQHPWDLWNTDGTAKPWTPQIRSVLEKLLTSSPYHPGANHYYIHVMEPSPFADKALASADRLGKTNPGLSHLVHMPSHIYLRTGNYKEGVDVNVNAVNSYQRSLHLYAPAAGADFLYLIHNLHMKTNNAMMGGDYNTASNAADETVKSVPKDYYQAPPPLGNYVQYIGVTPLFVQVRFHRWDEILNYPAPGPALVYSSLVYHFARGMAFSHKQNFDAAAAELDALRLFMKDSSLYMPFVPFSPAIEGAKVAEQLLLGSIHEQRGLFDGAIRHYRAADSIEVNMVYNEPRDWLLNPKQFLGNAYLQKNDLANAEKTFTSDLLYNRDNLFSLQGLYRVFNLQHKKANAAAIKAKIKKAAPGFVFNE